MSKLSEQLKSKVSAHFKEHEEFMLLQKRHEAARIEALKIGEMSKVEDDLKKIPKEMLKLAEQGYEGYEYKPSKHKALEDPDAIIARINQWAKENDLVVEVSVLTPLSYPVHTFDFSWLQ